jgi:hypothetical protein
MAKTYNCREVYITFGPIVITEPAPGSFVTITRDEQAFTKQIGAYGDGVRSKSNNKGGTVSVTLLQTSSVNEALSAIAKLDEISTEGVLPLMVKDASGQTLVESPGAWIQKLPDVEFAVEAGTREWIFDTDQLEMLVGGNS